MVALLPLSGTEMSFLGVLAHALRRKRVSNIGAMCEFDQNEDKFSAYFNLMNWNIASSKMVRNNILKG